MPSFENQRFFIKTFGCQMNVADTERMASLLADQGMAAAEDPNQAQVIIINGCSVREKAVHKALSALGEFQFLKKEGAGPIIGVGGCVGQLDKDKLFKNAPYLDFVFGTDTLDNLPEMVHRVRNGERHFVHADFDKSLDYSTETKVFGFKAQAFVNIMKGCDKYCTYCIVPYTRGKEKSRTIDEVVSDVARLVATGVREITLLGQNVNSFGKGNPNVRGRVPSELHNIIGKVGPRAGEENFPQLLRAIDQDPRCADLQRIRFTSSHPLDFSDELIECYAPASQGGVARLATHLHLPVQSGSNAVLQKMGRHHQIENYIAQMDRLRELSPDVGLSTDLIVGFPTETDADFQKTIELLDRVQFDNIYAFAYSPRPGTRAAKMKDDVPAKVKNERLVHLLNYQIKIAEKTYASRIGKVLEVLVEGEAKNDKLMRSQPEAQKNSGGKVWTGRTSCNRVVNFFSDSPRSLIGKMVPIRITKATGLSLQGEVELESLAAERVANRFLS
ncbi:MAG: tRNA (N6-isopentenyl adenosine(37)-C2)-methylthiotransferase MiaB [Bdellovibrio sp.]|nr:tRNA (N6-isopentenyl adenosine(37)-C2)-methylthiotransferase MiaB [Bdellovibrio sp.]